jgi:SAM-dependent methyltransferase
VNTKQLHELDFWVRLLKSEGNNFFERRRDDYRRHTNMFKGQIDLSGYGLEMGTGCYSMLEFSPAKSVIGVDPLAKEFNGILPKLNKKVDVLPEDGENLSFGGNVFDWVVCWNVIDHTPDPMKMASEMFRVLKPGGKLYFNVNFDDRLASCHYSLWNKEKVDYCLDDFVKLWEEETRNDPDEQTWYYGIFLKP